jgi:hypothetical protein
MLRFKIFASAVPLILAGVFARSELLPGPRPCIAVGDTSVQIASVPWHADLHVGFTDDPTVATVRVQIVDNAETADFVVVDDVDSAEGNNCEAGAATRFVAIATHPSASQPIIYLSQDGDADYRIFVKSKTFSAREAAALIVGASGGHPRIATASL